ncbi:MAG: SLBB domain-containing protein [Deltaproteobacteria bacterium]|nr:SLBB domain-containing protein [Deltaproteobacteria bacterium]
MHPAVSILLCLAWPAGLARAQEVDASAYVVGTGDLLDIRVFNEPDLSGTFRVHDGDVLALPLLGEVGVAGLTVSSLDDTLTRLYGERYLVRPDVTIQVTEYGSRAVQVLGAVGKPGVVYLQRPTRMLELLALAGGLNAEKAAREIHVQRTVDGASQSIVLKMDEVLAGGEGNIEIRAGDVVNVAEGLLVYVSGQVEKTGTVPFREGLTVSRAVAEAGGPKTYANLRETYILRGGERLKVNLKRILAGRAEDVLLQPGDQVVVEQRVF